MFYTQYIKLYSNYTVKIKNKNKQNKIYHCKTIDLQLCLHQSSSFLLTQHSW